MSFKTVYNKNGTSNSFIEPRGYDGCYFGLVDPTSLKQIAPEQTEKIKIVKTNVTKNADGTTSHFVIHLTDSSGREIDVAGDIPTEYAEKISYDDVLEIARNGYLELKARGFK
jgi:hypothetical protein